ncbi:MAG: helix-turn-helix transcriptional regulator [Thermodesulfovibrio sp.]
MKIGEIIKKIRKAKGFSQMELAEKIGVTYQQIQKYEKGISKITVERLIEISKALGVPISAFLSEISKENHIKTYSEEEIILIEYFRKISDPELRKSFLNILKKLATTEKVND